jgi:predicted ferric reductase
MRKQGLMFAAVIKTVAWLGLYIAIIALPTMAFMLGDVPPPRGFWLELSALLGFALLMMIALQFLLTGRFRGIGRPFGIDTIVQFHRHAGILMLLVLVAHPLIPILIDPKFLEFFDPRVNAPRAIFLILASIAMVLLIVLSVWRTAFGLNYEWWRISHAALAAGVVVVGVAHSWQVGHYVQGWGKRSLLVAIGAAALLLLVYVRIVRPWQMRRRPYRVAEVRDERGESSTVVLEPVGHEGMRFLGGQYAWLTLGDTPFTLQQHPFSFSSSERDAPHRIEFTAKELGDFTQHLVQVDVGTQAFLEGPFGLFVLPDEAPGAVFIMGGIGVTPTISILRSLRDKNDPRPLLLIYGNSKWRETAFRKELDKLQQHLNLRVVHVLTDAEDDWKGETGYIDRELLERHIGQQERGYPMFICGPAPMMDAVEDALLEMGIPLHQVRAERFNMV